MREHFYIPELDVRISNVDFVEDEDGASIAFDVYDAEHVSDEQIEGVKEWIMAAIQAAVDRALTDEYLDTSSTS